MNKLSWLPCVFLLIPFLFPGKSLWGLTISVPGQYGTLPQAVAAAANGDTILVSDGVYYVNDLSLQGKQIVLLSINGPEVTILDGNNAGGILDCVSGETFQTELNGFTLRNGQASVGAAIHLINSSYLTVRNCIIRQNSAPGIWTRAAITIGQISNNGAYTPAGIRMYDCRLESNSGYYGGAVFYEESGTMISEFERCVFLGNSANRGAAVYSTRNNTFRNCLFAGNSGASVIHNEDGHPLFLNCTFAQNSTYVFARNHPTLNTTIRNCIFWNNNGTFNEHDPARFQVSYTNDQGGFSGTGNISQDPQFVHPAGSNFQLQGSSPCIDSGDPDPVYNDPDNTRNDMGAFYFEQVVSPPPPPAPAGSLLQVVNDNVFVRSDEGSHGIILQAANGQCWRITIDESGEFVKTQVGCPE
ncbi:MAG: hypothetical protein RLY31_3188 [Bacteroidota bacterium]